MPSTLTATLATAMAIFAAIPINGHMLLRTPVPYGKSTLDNSPLVAAGTDFPCKQRASVYADEGARAKNQFPIGKPQTMSFAGSATHGGGSCQISLTTDKSPTKDSKWAVIKSIEGGCPGGANGGTAATFEYTIPSNVAPGDYTLAWTWFNKIGNREMYMNCAPITVIGGGSKVKRDTNTTEYEATTDSIFGKRDASFPAMFVANIGNGCKTVDSADLQFPDPGPGLQKAGTGAAPVPPTGTCPGKSEVSLGGSSAASGSSASNSSTPASKSTSASPSGSVPGTATILASPSPSLAAGGAAPASPSAAGGASGASPPGAGGASGASGASPPAEGGASGASGTSPPAAGGASGASGASPPAAGGASGAAGASPPATGGASGASPSAAGGASSGTESSGSGSAGSASPSSAAGSSGSGGLVCSADGSKFGLSGAGSIIMQPVAAGTKCVNGQITFAKSKRGSAKFRQGRKALDVGGWY